MPLDDDALIGHGRHISAAGGAGAHHDGKLGNAPRRHVGLVVKNAAEMVAVGEHLVLFRQKSAAGVHQVDAGQVVRLGDLLGPQVFFHRERIVGPALDGGVVGHDHAFAARHGPHAGDDAGGRHGVVVHPPGRQLRQLQERRAWIAQLADAFPGQELAAGAMPLPGFVAAALGDEGGLLIQVRYQSLHGRRVGLELGGLRVNGGLQQGHGALPCWRRCWQRLTGFLRTVPGRSACAVFRWCRRRFHTTWRRATSARWETR